MATSGQKSRSGAKSAGNRAAQQRRRVHHDETGIIPVLARVVRGIENAAERGKVNAANRMRYRVVAVVAREERARIKADTELSEVERGKELTRLDGIATIMAKTAARDATLIQLLTDTAPLSPAAQEVRRTLLMEAGAPLAPEDLVVVTEPEAKPAVEERKVVPQSVRQYQMSNPFLAPDFAAYATQKPASRSGHLDN